MKLEGDFYILQTRESIRLGESIYKVGRTCRKIEDRFKEYPNGSKLLFNTRVKNVFAAENEIIKKSKQIFKNIPLYGKEYFEAEFEKLKELCIKICEKHNTQYLYIAATPDIPTNVLIGFTNNLQQENKKFTEIDAPCEHFPIIKFQQEIHNSEIKKIKQRFTRLKELKNGENYFLQYKDAVEIVNCIIQDKWSENNELMIQKYKNIYNKSKWFIYIGLSEPHITKIGYSNNQEKILNEFYNLKSIEFIHTSHANDIIKYIKNEFKDKKIQDEWFNVDKQTIMNFVNTKFT